MRGRLSVGILAIGLGTSALAQTLEPLGMAAYQLTCLATSDGRLFVGTPGQGVFMQDSQGREWRSLGLEGVTVLSLYPHDVGPLGWCIGAGAQPSGYGADTALVYCWTPSDSQWTPMDKGLERSEVLAVFALAGFPDPRICGETFAGGGEGVYRRALGSEAWERVCRWLFAKVRDLKVDPVRRTVWAVGGGRCTFIPLAAKSTDAGDTWELLFPPSLTLENSCLSLAFHPRWSDTVLVGMTGAVVRTADGGKAWRFVLQEEGTDFEGLAIDTGDPMHVWAAGSGSDRSCRFWESLDGGRQWLRMRRVEETLASGVVRLVADPSAAGVVYIATSRNGVWRYENQAAPLSQDAIILALRLQKGIPLDMALAEEIDQALKAAREAVRAVESIHAFPDYVPTELLVEADAPWTHAWARGELWTGNQAVDALGREFLLTGVRALFPTGQRQWWLLTFAAPLKVPLLARLYQACAGVLTAAPNGYAGDGDNIQAFKKNEVWHFVFSKGWGDCPAGCIDRYYWYVTVSPDLSARLVAEWRQDFSAPRIHLWNVPPGYAATVFRSTEELFLAVGAPEWWVRRHALEVIGRLFACASPWVGEDMSNPLLFAELRQGVRQRRSEVISLVRYCLSDPDEDVRTSARQALTRVLGLEGGDLACYFPLAVGNWWRFTGGQHLEVIDTLRLGGQLFFQLGSLPQVGWAYVRFGEDNKLAVATADTPRCWLDFAAEIGQTWIVFAPGSGSHWTVSLESTSDTVTVPAGTFANCYRFLFRFSGSDNDWVEWYAPGVGPVKRTLYGFAVIHSLLEAASVNGVEVPAGVETPAGLEVPSELCLLPPQPNPFARTALLSYYLPADGQVTLVVYDLLGRQLRTLVSGERAAGTHRVVWDGKDDQGRLLPTGQYLCVLRHKKGRQAQKVVLLR